MIATEPPKEWLMVNGERSEHANASIQMAHRKIVFR